MSLRSTLALLAAFVALVGYVYFIELRGTEQRLAAESAAKRVVSLAPGSVTRLELDSSEGTRVVLARTGDAWALEQPVVYPADPQTVDAALGALAKLESTATIAERPADLEPFGLGATRKTVIAKAGDAAPVTLALGGPTPVGGGRYVELAGDPAKLFVVPAPALAPLEVPLFELRDRRLVRLETGKADELVVRAGGVLVTRAKKTDAGWQLVEPVTGPGDAERIRRLLDDLSLARASAFEDAPKAPASYGLAQPALELEIRAPGAEERLAIGEADGKTWVQRAGESVLLEANERVRTGVPTGFFDYREKRVLDLDTEQVHALEIVFPRSNELHRITREGEAWKAAEAGVELKPLVADDLLYALADLDATGVDEVSLDRKAVGLDPAAVVFRAFDANGAALGELSIGDADVARGLPALSSQNPTPWRIANEFGRQAPLSPEAWRNLMLKAPEPAPPAAPPVPEAPPAQPPS